jgi:hypothetical protein
METMQLREQQVYPTAEVLKNAMGKSYSAYEDLIRILTDTNYGLVPEWNYYRDGKAWLCKVCYKKKTIFWLSVWDKFFKTTFYFTERNGTGVAGLEIEEKLKADFSSNKPFGRLIPLTVHIKNKEQIKDVLTIAAYKKNLK